MIIEWFKKTTHLSSMPQEAIHSCPPKFKKVCTADGKLGSSFRIVISDRRGQEIPISSYRNNSGQTRYLLYDFYSEDDVAVALDKICKFMDASHHIQIFPVYLGDIDPMYAEPSNVSVCQFTLNGGEFRLRADYDSCTISLYSTTKSDDPSFCDMLAVEIVLCLAECFPKVSGSSQESP